MKLDTNVECFFIFLFYYDDDDNNNNSIHFGSLLCATSTSSRPVIDRLSTREECSNKYSKIRNRL